MKALILVGGYGTRLRPLTFSAPKPLVPFANKAMVLHQLEALVRIGVKKIIFAVSFQAEATERTMKDWAHKHKVEVIFSVENEPLGTAGPLALAKKHLLSDNEPLFMFNSDVICEFPLEKLLAFHREHKGEGTICVTPVKDPSKYGVVVYDDRGQIKRFVEKPTEFVGDKINAGIYILNVEILNRVELKPTSIEREIFPKMVEDKKLFAFALDGFWMDVGQPKDYLIGQSLYLGSAAGQAARNQDKQVNDIQFAGVTIKGNVLIDPSAKIGAGCVVGPDVIIGPGVILGDGVRVERAAIFENTKVRAHAFIKNAIIGWENHVGAWAHLEDVVSGRDVGFGEGICVFNVSVCPHKSLSSNELQSSSSSKIIM